MELLMLLMLLTAVTAGPPVHQPIETVYTVDKEYIYKYESQVISGLPLGSKIYSGLKVKGLVRLQKTSIKEMKLELKEPQLLKLLGAVESYDPTREVIPDKALVELLDEDADLMKSKLIKPIKFMYERGHVEGLITEGDDPDWSVNIKKGILSLLEINFNDRHSLSPMVDVDNINPKLKLYTVLEASVSGECETSYRLQSDLSRAGVPSMDLTKVRHLTRCIDPLITSRSYSKEEQCDKISDHLTAQSSVRYSLLGLPGQYIIMSVVGESQYNMVPHTEKQGRLATLTNQTLYLVDSRRITDQIRDPKSHRLHDLPLTVQDPEVERKKALTQRPMIVSSERQERVELVQKVLSGIDPLMKDKVGEEVTTLIKDLHRLLVRLDKTGLEEVLQTLDKDPTKYRARKVLLDVLPTVGTHAAVDVLLDRLESKPESPLATTISLMTLALLPEADIPIVKRIMDFVEKVDKKDPLVKRTAYLCLGALGHKMNKRNHSEITDLKNQEKLIKVLLEDSNDRELREQLHVKLDKVKDDLDQTEKLHSAAKEDIIKMVKKLYKSEDEDDKLLALKVMGNLAVTDFLDLLKITLHDRNTPYIHRMTALIGLKKLAKTNPKKIHDILLPLFYDRTEEEELRGLAVLVSLMLNLPEPELEMVVKSLADEPSSHVRALVASVLAQLSSVQSPCKCLQSLKRNITLAHRYTEELEPGLHKSNMLHKLIYDKELDAGQIYEQIMLYSSKEKLPRALAMVLTSISGGKSAKILEAGYMAKGLDGVLNTILDDQHLSGVSELMRTILHPRHARSTTGHEQDIKDIKKKLGVKARKLEPLQGNVFLSLYGHELIYLDLHHLLPHKDNPTDIAGILDILRHLKHLTEGQGSLMLPLHRSSLTTEAGLPLMLDTKLTGALKLDGDIDIKLDPKLSKKKSLISEFDALLRLRISGVAESVTDMLADLKTIQSGVSVKSKLSLDIPAKFSINMDPDKYKLLIKITDQKKYEPLKIEMAPVAVIKKLPEKTALYPLPLEEAEINVIHGAELETISYDLGELYLGRKLSIAGVRAVRLDNGLSLPSISGKQHLHLVYDPMSHKDLDIQFQHVRVKPHDAEKATSPPKSSWWPFKWLMAPSDTAPPEYEGTEVELQKPEEKTVKGFINLEDEDLSISYLKSKFSKEVDILQSGDKCGLLIRVADPGPSPTHELQLATLYQEDGSLHKHLYAIELRRKPILDEKKDWKMITSLKLDLPVTEAEPSDLEDNVYQHEVEKQIREITEEPQHSIGLKSRLLLKVLIDPTFPELKTDKDKLLETIISYILDKEVGDSMEDLKVLVQKQRKLQKDLASMDKQEIKPMKKKYYIDYLKMKVEKSKYIISELVEKLDKLVTGKQKPEEAVVVLYILSSQKYSQKKLKHLTEKFQPLLALDEKIAVDKIMVDLLKDYDKLKDKQEKHSLDKQVGEKDKARLEIDPDDRNTHKDLMNLEKKLILIKIKPLYKLSDPIEIKKNVLETHSKLDSTIKDIRKIIHQLDEKLEQKVYLSKMLHMKIIEILLHQRLVILDLSDSELLHKLSITGKDPQHIDIYSLLHKQKEEIILYSRKTLGRLFISLDAMKDLRSLVSLTTQKEQEHLKSLQKLKIMQLTLLEHLDEIYHLEKGQPLPYQILHDEIYKIKDISKNVKDILDPLLKDELKPILSPIVVRALKILATQMPISDKALKIMKHRTLIKVVSKAADASKELDLKQEIIQMKLDVIKDIELICKVHLREISDPDILKTVSIPTLLKKSLKLEASHLKLQHLMTLVTEKLEKTADPHAHADEDVYKYNLLYDAISLANDVQTGIELLRTEIHDNLQELPKDGSVADLLKLLEKRQKEHLKLVKHIEDILKDKAHLDHSLYTPLQDIQKLKDRALRHGLKLEDLKKTHGKVSGGGLGPLPARNPLPQRSLHKPLQATIHITYGTLEGMQKHVELLLLGRKSLEQLLWEKDQSLPDKQDRLVSSYLQDKLIKDDRAALGYTHIKQELNTYRHLHVLCTYEDSLPASVRLLIWKSHELLNLLYYKKVTLLLPDKTNAPNTLEIRLDLKQDNKMLDMEIKTPYETNLLRHLEVPYLIKLAAIPRGRPLKEHLVHTLTGANTEATCEVSKDRIKTLLGTRYMYELDKMSGGCEHVLAMDCGLSDKLIITSKPVHGLPDKKILKIVTLEHTIEVIPHKLDIEIKVDDDKKDLKGPLNIKGKLYIHKLHYGYLEIKLHDLGISVITDGKRSSIKAHKLVSPKLCGLCGELTATLDTDLRDPLQLPLPQPRPYISTYLVPSGTCDANTIQKKLKVPEIRRLAKLTSPVERTMILLQDKLGKTCFSRTPVKSCPSKAKPEGIRSVLVSFYCLRSNHPRVASYTEKAKKQILADLQYKRISVNKYVSEPADCLTQ